MNGSEKQISWAKQIRIEFEEKIQKIVDYAEDRTNRETMPKEYYKIALCLQDSILKTMDNWTAVEYINNRFNSNFETILIKLYEKTINCNKRKEKLEILYKELKEKK
jgi:hypothetical protein